MNQKVKTFRSKKIRDSARGQECTMNSLICNYNPETVVYCHSEEKEHGKGTALKSDDRYGFYGCSSCHDWYDGKPVPHGTRGTKTKRRKYFWMAFGKTRYRMEQTGLMKIIIQGEKQ